MTWSPDRGFQARSDEGLPSRIGPLHLPFAVCNESV
jgi:hypothetical protein